MQILTVAAESYIHTFRSYTHFFLGWGETIFVSLLTINIVWWALAYAFEKGSVPEAMLDFIKRFFVVGLFYSIMLHPEWLFSLLKTTEVMGQQLTHMPLDPSSLIAEGIGLANRIIMPVQQANLLTMGFSLIVLSIVYLIVLFVFIQVALDLTLTLIMTSALISMSALFLSFSALGVTSNIARHTLDVILANCVKLLGIYIVIAAGSQTLDRIAAAIPTQVTSLDPYAWLVAVTLLFWLLAKNLPQQLARMITISAHDNVGTGVTDIAYSAIRHARTMTGGAQVAQNAGMSVARLVGSTAANASGHFGQGMAQTGSTLAGLDKATSGTLRDLTQSVGGHISDHFKDLANKLAGGPGRRQSIRSVSERMYQKTQTMKKDPHNDESK
jgi:type IV secretory pathway TrbL component